MRTGQKQWQAQVQQPLRRAALALALAYAFIVFSDIHELLAIFLGIKPYILIITTVPMIVLVLLSGGVRRTVHWPAAKYWLGFAAWMIIALPFSSWRSASLSRTILWTRADLPMLFAIAGCVMTLKEFDRLLNVLSWAAAVDITAGRLFAGQIMGRLELEGTTIDDPNDYAAHLLFLLPFLILVIVRPDRSKSVRAIAMVLTLYGFYLLLATGSRGGLLAVTAMVLFCLWKLRPQQKVRVAVIVAALACLAIVIVPGQILTRFSTIFRGTSESSGRYLSDEEIRAMESADARSYTLHQSILATRSHPFFGVGLGEFQNYEGRTSREKGQHGYWHETHNSYTQVSSELGIPALFFYVAGIIVSYRMSNRLYNQAQRDSRTPDVHLIAMTAFCLQLSLIGFCTASFFLSLAYRFYQPAMAGLAIAFSRAVQQRCEPIAETLSNDILYEDAVVNER